jgi:oligopeptide/dipeptide ABC transporter ATP-binding protein
MGDKILKIRNLSVEFLTPRGRVQALRDVNFSVPKGKIVGIVGESGCGKSTVIMAIIKLLASNAKIISGIIEFEGKNILNMSKSELRSIRGKRFSVVFQDPMTSLNPVLSIGRQMIDIQYRSNWKKKEKLKLAANMLARVGIPDSERRLSSYLHHFSGGMRQRIAISMALMANPALLIADEPTTALDATLEMQIVHLLKELQSVLQCSTLFVSHHLGLIAELCDFVVVMYAGEVIEYGSVRDVFLNPAHPYTRKLLECDPARIKHRCSILPTIPGEVPDLMNIQEECIFRSRCSSAFDICEKSIPTDSLIKPGHIAKCHLLTRKEEV